MEVVQQPQALTFVGNIPDVIVTGELGFTAKLLQGSEEIFEEIYIFDNDGQARIPLEELIDQYLSIAIPDVALFEQTEGAKDFTLQLIQGLDPAIDIEFTAIKGGVDRENFTTLDWVKENFLTWQPQTKTVKWLDPNYLGYYATEAVVIKAKGYFSGGTDETITLHEIASAGLWTFDALYANLSDQFATQPIYIDIWAESVAQTEGSPSFITWTQRYLLTDEEYDFDDLFVFENSLGGVDTIRLTGEKKLVNANKFDLGLFYDRISLEYQVNPDKAFEKNTGYYPNKNTLKWSQDFFSSKQKYVYESENLVRILTRDPELTDIEHELVAFDFVYIYTEQTFYLDLLREDQAFPVLQVFGPGDEEFFLQLREYLFPSLANPSEALFLVLDPDEKKWKTLSMAALLAYLLMNLNIESGNLDPDILESLMASQNPSGANAMITQSKLDEILAAFELPSGPRVVSVDLRISSTTAGVITSEWVDNEGDTNTVTDAALVFVGSPGAGNFRWDNVLGNDDGTVSIQTGTAADVNGLQIPNPPAGSIILRSILWNEEGEAQVNNPPGQQNNQSSWSSTRFSTQTTAGSTGQFAKIWEGNLSKDNNYAIDILYNDPRSVTNFNGSGMGRLKVSWTCDPSRNIQTETVKIFTDADSVAGEFRLVQISGNKAALYHKGSHFWSRIDFRVVFQSSAVRLQDFVNNGAYGAAPTAVGTWDSAANIGIDPSQYYLKSEIDPLASIGSVIQFDRPRTYGSISAPITATTLTDDDTGLKSVVQIIFHQAAELNVPATWFETESSEEYDPIRIAVIIVESYSATYKRYAITYDK